MKRFFLLMVAMMLLLAACSGDSPLPTDGGGTSSSPTAQAMQPPREPGKTSATIADGVFAAKSVICGVPVGGMTEGEAREALAEAAKDYSLSLVVNGQDLTVSGEEIGLCVDEARFEDFCRTPEDGAVVLTYRYNDLYLAISGVLEAPARDASISYSTGEKQFVVEAEQRGAIYDMTQIMNEAGAAVSALLPDAGIQAGCSEIQPAVTVDSPQLQDALEKANAWLQTDLTYTFTPDGGETKSETLSKDTIGSFVAVSDKLEVTLDDAAIQSYAAGLDEKYSVADYSGDFRTTYGGTIGYTVDYGGQRVNVAALAEDICSCIMSGTSGTRQAPYNPKTAADDMPFGGNYVEINLSAQHVWVYQDGQCVVSTDMVSGCPAEGNGTPNGVYSVQDLDRDCYLSGETWDTFVSYWIGFYGGYGLHDASWRWSFGGDIYLYGGSHGCVNLPADVADDVYYNVNLGTKVIVYGGTYSVDPLEEEIYGTTSYSVAEDAAPFNLDITLAHEGDRTKVTYTSSNPKVATVSADGTVTVTGKGSAAITVNVAGYSYHTEATMTVQIDVHSACDEGRHSYGAWTQTVAPTCKPGTEKQTCSKCGHTQTREIAAVSAHTPGEWTVATEPGCETAGKETTGCTVCGKQMEQEIPAIGHSFTSDSPVCGNGCGTGNPDYTPPTTEEETVPDETTEETTGENP